MALPLMWCLEWFHASCHTPHSTCSLKPESCDSAGNKGASHCLTRLRREEPVGGAPATAQAPTAIEAPVAKAS